MTSSKIIVIWEGVIYFNEEPMKADTVGSGVWSFVNKWGKDAVVINFNLNHILDKISLGISPLTKQN